MIWSSPRPLNTQRRLLYLLSGKHITALKIFDLQRKAILLFRAKSCNMVLTEYKIWTSLASYLDTKLTVEVKRRIFLTRSCLRSSVTCSTAIFYISKADFSLTATQAHHLQCRIWPYPSSFLSWDLLSVILHTLPLVSFLCGTRT